MRAFVIIVAAIGTIVSPVTLNHIKQTTQVETPERDTQNSNETIITHAQRHAQSSHIQKIYNEAFLTEQTNGTNCSMRVSNKSINYFISRLDFASPKLIHFMITVVDENKTIHPYKWDSNAFHPRQWVWTYQSFNGFYPYLHWNADYGLLSFGLLDAMTLPNKPYIEIIAPKSCPVVFGNHNTTSHIAEALLGLTKGLEHISSTRYRNSYYCYLARDPTIRDTFQYKAALYALYPISYINYNCCKTHYNYTTDTYQYDCLDKQITKWVQCMLGPYVLGIVIFLYFPIYLLSFAGWSAKNLKVIAREYNPINEIINEEALNDGTPVVNQHNAEIEDIDGDVDWLYLDGTPPKTLFGLLKVIWCGLDESHPVIVSRIKRLVFILLSPSVVYIQIMLYHFKFSEYIGDLISHGTPMGFLSMLGRCREDRDTTFVPGLGGPAYILGINMILGIIFAVFPSSLKQIAEDGMSESNVNIPSPLCLGASEIRALSMMPDRSEPGYNNCMVTYKCGIYMIFSKKFWLRVVQIQRERIALSETSKTAILVLKLFCLPIYLLLCLIEIMLSVTYFGIPFFPFIGTIVKGAVIHLMNLRSSGESRNKFLSAAFTNPIIGVIGTFIILIMFLFYSYSFSLIFIESFQFLSQILVFCFVAVIVYPSVAFGYLFFFVIMVYYIIRLVHGFGEAYLELLFETVEISRNLDGQQNHVSTFGGHFTISNVKQFDIKSMRINNRLIDVPQNTLQSIFTNISSVPKLRLKEHTYGIPKSLFKFMVRKHLPVHEQILKVVLQIGMITFLIIVTMSIISDFVTGPTTEMSEVMHFVFIVTVGALPRVLEVAMSDASEPMKKEIELRRLEQSVVEFWQIELHHNA